MRIIKSKARRTLIPCRRTIALRRSKYDAGWPEDYVVEQRPMPKQKMKAGRPIKVFLSRGTEAVTVRRVIGQSVSEAESILKSVGLKIGSVVEVHSDDFPQKGIIIAHTPTANATVQRDSKVNLLVSLGAYSVRLMVPDLRGMKLQSVLELLESNGLRLGRITREVSPVVEEANVILEQIPQPNDRVESGTTVDVVVSSPGEALEGKTSRKLLEIILLTNNVGDHKEIGIGATFMMFAGDKILNITSDNSTGGTVAYLLAHKVTEFDAYPIEVSPFPIRQPEADIQEPEEKVWWKQILGW